MLLTRFSLNEYAYTYEINYAIVRVMFKITLK